jgi:hypothetical protein
MTSTNYVYDQGQYRVVRGWVEGGDNLTLYGPHNPILSIKYEDGAWMEDVEKVEASMMRPFDKRGIPLIEGPYYW